MKADLDMGKIRSFEDIAFKFFNFLLSKTTDNPKLFFKIWDMFPKLADRFDRETEEELKDVELPHYTEEEMREQWEKLCDRIRARYGQDAI